MELDQHWLNKYNNYLVEVYYTDGNRDRGRLSDFGDGWIEISRQDQETLLIPFTAIRVLKLLDAPKDDAHRLLRPATPDR